MGKLITDLLKAILKENNGVADDGHEDPELDDLLPDDQDIDTNGEDSGLDPTEEADPELGDDDIDDAIASATGGEGADTPEEPTNPNKAGVLRHVKGAHLVYKREMDDGTYEEMWIYNSTNLKDSMEIKKDILSGTDVPTDGEESPDNAQKVDVWASGNATIVKISGLSQ